ncbi:MAG: MarR family transcriptional regulator [Tannerellaceae bacterium]|nr:MarR family transcriptional regulator [Tannerellaceae bacterium]
MIANVRVKEKTHQPSGLTPVAQYLLLYYLSENQSEFTIRQLEAILPYNYVALARAVVNLEELQLCQTEKDDTGTKIICFEQNKRELWAKAQKYLSSPVKRIVYSDTLPDNEFKISGINALAHYSHLNPEQSETNAIWDKDFAGLSVQFNEIEGVYKIGIWKYPPFMPYSIGSKYVDKLSLYLSLKNEPDARVEKELEILIENMQW